MKIRELLISETATAGATSAGNIASVANPQVAIGRRQIQKNLHRHTGCVRHTSSTITQDYTTQKSRRHGQGCPRTAGSEPVWWTGGGEKMMEEFEGPILILKTEWKLKNKVVTCLNCGRPSHCGGALIQDLDEMKDVRICDHCRCKACDED
jgi:hypothetical protein